MPRPDARRGRRAASPRTVALTGFMGAGKTSVARALARRLGWPFVDLDERIEARTRRAVHEIFEKAGESGFRAAETAALRAVLARARRPLLLALGGGTLVRPQNRALLRAAGARIVFLQAPLAVLRERCAGSGRKRPLFADEPSFRRLYLRRQPGYARAGTRVETGGRTPKEVAEVIVRRLRLARGHPA